MFHASRKVALIISNIISEKEKYGERKKQLAINNSMCYF